MNNIQIIEATDSIAEAVIMNNGNATIYLHPDLKKDKVLYDHVLLHELKHVDGKQHDWWIDFSEIFNIRKQLRMTKFVLQHKFLFLQQLFSFGRIHEGVRVYDYLKIVTVLSVLLIGLLLGVLI